MDARMTVSMDRRARLLALLALVLLAPLAGAESDSMFDPRFREGAPSDELAAGPPRLARGHVSAFVDLLEASFDVALPARAEQDLRDALENEYLASATAAREGFLALVDGIATLRTRARAGETSLVREGLRAFRAAVDERIREAPAAPANVIVTRLLERRHEVLWAGEPPIKGASVDAYIEFAEFVAGLARNEAVVLSPGRRSALQDYLGRDLAKVGTKLRESLARAHRTWLRVKARWDRAKDARRFLMRWEAVKLLARLHPTKPPLEVKPGTDLASYARVASKVAAAWDPFDAVTALARNPAAMLEATVRGLELKEKEPAFTFLFR
jgi:hypothetical protein